MSLLHLKVSRMSGKIELCNARHDTEVKAEIAVFSQAQYGNNN